MWYVIFLFMVKPKRSKHVLSKKRARHKKDRHHNHASFNLVLNVIIPGLGSVLYGKFIGLAQLFVFCVAVFLLVSFDGWSRVLGVGLYVLDVIWAFFSSVHSFHEIYPHK